MKLLDKINNDIEGELQAYSRYEEDMNLGMDEFNQGILEGRKEFAEQLFDLINSIDKVLEQIKKDVGMGDMTAIAELLSEVPEKTLRGFLSEELANKEDK